MCTTLVTEGGLVRGSSLIWSTFVIVGGDLAAVDANVKKIKAELSAAIADGAPG